MNLHEKTIETNKPIFIQPVNAEGSFVLSKDFFYEEIQGSTDLEEVSHALVALDSGATYMTVSIDEHAGSMHADIYESAQTRVYMASAIDSKATGTILDSKHTIQAAGVDAQDEDAVKHVMQEGYQGALQSIANIGERYGVGGLELLNELALLVKTQRKPGTPLVLELSQLNELIDKAASNVKANTGEGKRYSSPIFKKDMNAHLAEDQLQQKVEEARKEVLLVSTWPKGDRTKRQSILYREDEIKNRRKDTSECGCGGYGFHLQTCPLSDTLLPNSVEPIASNILGNFYRDKRTNPPSTN